MFSKVIEPKNGPAAIGPYSPAIKLGDFVYVSGQLPVNEAGEIVSDSIEEQTRQCIKNIENVLAGANLKLHHVMKTTIFMSDLSEFAKMNEVYAECFAQPYPARSAFRLLLCQKVLKLKSNAW